KLGTLDHPIIKDREVFIRPEILRKQFCVTGATGSGKTNLLNRILNNFNQSFVEAIEPTPGYSLVDPSGSAIKLLLNRLRVFETFEGYEVDWNKVHFIKVKDSEYPLACNLLAKLDGENSEEMIDNVFRIISENFDTATQAERLLRYTIKALIHDPKETHTIMSVIRMLYKNDDIFRKRIIDRIRPYTEMYEVVNFFDNEASDLIESPSGQAVLNRLDVFKSNSTLRNLFCQKDFNLPIRKWMDEGHIVFYDLVGMSEQEIKIFCSYIAYMYYRVADQRPADTSLLHLTVVDEAHKVQASIFPKIISEQRKFGHSLGIATQNLDDLNSELRSALVNNQSNFFVCRQGESGSVLANKIFKSSDRKEQHYTESYFKQLPDNVCALSTQDVIEDETVNIKTQVKIKPIDRVMEDGKVANYKDKYEPKIADEWTMKKAIELSANNGMYYKEIPKMVRAFFEDEVYTYRGKPQEEFKADLIKRKPVVPEDIKRKPKEQKNEQQTKKPKLRKNKNILKTSKEEVNQEEQAKSEDNKKILQENEDTSKVGSFLSGFTDKGD
ncbi:helicase HerA domain-containing protein, partial [Staphylococcus aureus]